MSLINPDIMSAWLGRQPAAASTGLNTQASAAVWNITVAPGSVWEAITRRSTSCHFLWVALDPFPVDYVVDGRQVWKGAVERNAMHLVRAGEAVRALWHGSGRVLHLYIPHELLVDVAQEFDHAEFELMERGLHVDPRWHAISAMLLERIGTRDKLAQLEIDNIGMIACAQLLRSWSTVRTGEAKGRLGQWQTRRAIDFLMDHLATNIGVSDLASHVGLSPYHFTRAFRRTVGVSPHRYLLLRRLDKAKELLERTVLSVTAIAARVGYQDPNQLARLFRAELGTTPTAYRRKHRR